MSNAFLTFFLKGHDLIMDRRRLLAVEVAGELLKKLLGHAVKRLIRRRGLVFAHHMTLLRGRATVK